MNDKPKGTFYVEYDDETNSYGVFHTDRGCTMYASFSDKDNAEQCCKMYNAEQFAAEADHNARK